MEHVSRGTVKAMTCIIWNYTNNFDYCLWGRIIGIEICVLDDHISNNAPHTAVSLLMHNNHTYIYSTISAEYAFMYISEILHTLGETSLSDSVAILLCQSGVTTRM